MTAIIKNNDNAIDNLFGNADEMSDFLWENLVGYNSPYILATAAAKRLPFGSYDIIPDDSIPKMAAHLEAKGFSLPEMTDNSCDPGLCSAMLSELIWDSSSKKEYAIIKKELKQEGAKAYLQRTKDALADQPEPDHRGPEYWTAKDWADDNGGNDFLVQHQDYFINLEDASGSETSLMITMIKNTIQTHTIEAHLFELGTSAEEIDETIMDSLDWDDTANWAYALLCSKLDEDDD